MLKRNLLAGAITILGIGLLEFLSVSSNGHRPPPELRVVSIEPADVVDDAGVELVWLSLSISNSEAFSHEPVFVKDAGVPVKARLGNHWIQAQWRQTEAKLSNCALMPFEAQRAMILAPGNADAYRVCFQYAGAVIETKWRLACLAEKLPGYIRFRIPHTFWAWVGFNHYRPSSKWQERTLDVVNQSHGTGA
jgi:hypothetical protein